MGIISLTNSKKGKLYFKFFIAAALIAVALFSYFALASAPTSTPVASPAIVSNNGTLLGSTQIANASIAAAAQQLFFSSNFSAENASQETNSTFKWFKRTLYQPQNREVEL